MITCDYSRAVRLSMGSDLLWIPTPRGCYTTHSQMSKRSPQNSEKGILLSKYISNKASTCRSKNDKAFRLSPFILRQMRVRARLGVSPKTEYNTSQCHQRHIYQCNTHVTSYPIVQKGVKIPNPHQTHVLEYIPDM